MNQVDFLREAAIVARMQSHDADTQNGAVLVAHDGIVKAANGLPGGIASTPMRLIRPEKYKYFEHAERGVIYAAARRGISTDGATLYCPWFACADCARAIICAGVHEVVGSIRARAATPDRWVSRVVDGEMLLREGGVSMRWIAEHLGIWVMFDGRPLEL